MDFDGGEVTWEAGDDLGNCGSFAELADLVAGGVLPEHPEDVAVAAWEVVLEPPARGNSPPPDGKAAAP